jgi:GNAT superfamily N-acetyltransferase
VTTAAPHALRTGEQIIVREIEAEDKPLLRDAFAHLSEESRYKRFLAPVSSLSDRELRYLTEIDHHDHEGLLACAGDGTPLGVARYVRDPARPQEAEVAVAVIDEWQGRGVGTALLDDLVDHALANGVTTFTALCLVSNKEIIELLGEVGDESIKAMPGEGTLELRVRLPLDGPRRPSLRSFPRTIR